jgi:zinc ribbon protein
MAYCPNCGDDISEDARTCPTCEADFGPNSAWHPLTEPPALRDQQNIAEFRAATEQRRQKREREARAALVRAEQDQNPEIQAAVKKNRRTMLALVLGYLITCFVGAILLAVQFLGTPGAVLVGFLLILFPILPVFLLMVWPWLVVLWIAGFVVCSFLILGLLQDKRNGEGDT